MILKYILINIPLHHVICSTLSDLIHRRMPYAQLVTCKSLHVLAHFHSMPQCHHRVYPFYQRNKPTACKEGRDRKDNHQWGKKMIMIVKTPGSQMGSPERGESFYKTGFFHFQFIVSSKDYNCIASTLFLKRDNAFYFLCLHVFQGVTLVHNSTTRKHFG